MVLHILCEVCDKYVTNRTKKQYINYELKILFPLIESSKEI